MDIFTTQNVSTCGFAARGQVYTLAKDWGSLPESSHGSLAKEQSLHQGFFVHPKSNSGDISS